MQHIEVLVATLIRICGNVFHVSHGLGSDDIVAMLNDFGADVDARDATGQTPLHVACCYGRVNIVRSGIFVLKFLLVFSNIRYT